MACSTANAFHLLQDVRSILDAVQTGRGAALVDRTSLLGTLNRGTAQPSESKRAELVAFLNIDLEFGVYELPGALDAISSALPAGLERAGWTCDFCTIDPECRGGLWAELRCRRSSTGSNEDSALTPGQAMTASNSGQASTEDPYLLQLSLAENMSSSVAAARQTPSGDHALGAGAAAGASSLGEPDGSDNGGEGDFLPWPLNPAKAQQQQRNLLAKAESRLKRCTRTSADGMAATAAGWFAKVACGVAEAERLCWARQPRAVRAAARAGHDAWRRAVAQQLAGDDLPPDAGGGAASLGPVVDSVFHLLDVLTLYAHQESLGGTHGEEAGGESQDLPKRVFGILSAGHVEGDGVLEVVLPGSILSSESRAEAGSGAEGGVGAGERKAPVGPGAKALVVPDPCFPVLDLHAAACRAVGGAQGPSAGAEKLRRLAGLALQFFA